MNLLSVREIFRNKEQYLDKEIEIGGWVRSIRDSKTFGFIVLNDGTFFEPIQVVYNDSMGNFAEVSKLNVGAALIVKGTLVATPQAKQPFEIQADTVEVEVVQIILYQIIYKDGENTYNEYYDERVTETEDIPQPSQPTGIKVILNGKQLEFDVEPMLINSRTMVPMRVIFEALGAKVDWDGSTQTAIGETKKTTVKITIGKDYLLKNDNIVVLDSPAVVISGRTLVPVRAIAESLDCKVEWYGETQVVEILK